MKANLMETNISPKTNYNSKITVLSFGGGQDSTAILYKLIYDEDWKKKYWVGKLVVIMANTGNEHPETYAHVDKMWSFCAKRGIEFYLLGFEYTPTSYKYGLVYHYELKNNIGSKAYPKTCTANLKITPIYSFLDEYIKLNFFADAEPFYRTKFMQKKERWAVYTKKGSQVRNKNWSENDFATEKEAQDIVNTLNQSTGGKRSITEIGERDGKINMIIGIALGEEGRVSEDDPDATGWQSKIGRVYPLIEESMDREACQKYIASTGNEVPIPSACIICPFMNDQELLYIYRFQRDWYEKWVELERNKIEAGAYKGDLTKTMNSEGKIVDNLGVWSKKLLPEKLIEVKAKYGHMTDEEVRDYRFSHGHCVKNKM
jgi:hypothetical protein